MAPDKNEEIRRWMTIGFCITAYIFFIYNVLAAYLSFIGSHGLNPLLT